MPIPAAGDPSPPFYPLNGSLWMLWATAPSESDALTRFVQIPFYVLLFLAVVRLSLEIHVPPAGALTAGLLTISQLVSSPREPNMKKWLSTVEDDRVELTTSGPSLTPTLVSGPLRMAGPQALTPSSRFSSRMISTFGERFVHETLLSVNFDFV
jgi:hypothetical protein